LRFDHQILQNRQRNPKYDEIKIQLLIFKIIFIVVLLRKDYICTDYKKFNTVIWFITFGLNYFILYYYNLNTTNDKAINLMKHNTSTMNVNKLLRNATIIFLAILSNFSYAQQEAQFTQYLDNMAYYNPAYAGTHGVMNLTALHRQQWVGFDGAPMSTTFNIHSPIGWDNLGIGISALNDRVGPNNSTWINADVSYSLRFKKHKGRLSFGIKGGINLLNGDISKLTTNNPNDNTLNVSYNNEIDPNFGAGIYYHSNQFFAGIAVPRILDNSKDPDILNKEYISQRHYYLTLGGYIPAGRMLKIRPSAMLKITENAPMALDVNLGFIFYDKFWLGANYRLLESAGLYFQISISNQFKLGYAFEYSTTEIRSHNAGTHELMISYDINLFKKSITSPRFF